MYDALRGMMALGVQHQILSSSPTAVAELFAQVSLDGVTWAGVDDDVTPLLPTPLTDNGSDDVRVFIGGALANAPFSRVGIQVSSSTADIPVEVRLSVTVTPMVEAAGSELVSGYGISVTSTPVSIGPIFNTTDVGKVVIFADASGLDTGMEVSLGVYTMMGSSPPNWALVSTSVLTLTEGVEVTGISGITNESLGEFAQVYVLGSDSANGSLSASVLLRPRS